MAVQGTEVEVREPMSQKLIHGAVRAIAFAREEARRVNHAWLGTEHLLVGVARARSGGSARVLAVTQLDELGRLRAALGVVSPRRPAKPQNAYLPLTVRARTALEEAARAARDLGRAKIGTEHILLGLLADPTSAACGIIHRMGSDVGRVRGELLDDLRTAVVDSLEAVAAAEEVNEAEASEPNLLATFAARAPLPKARPTEPPLYACPRGHGPMEKLREGDLEVAICAECRGTFVPAGQLTAVLRRFAHEAAE